MTVPVQSRRQTYTGNGATTAFAVPFHFFEISVYVNGTFVSPSSYSVSQPAAGGPGTVTFYAAPTGSVVIVGATTLHQPIDYITPDTVDPETAEQGYDRLTMIAQEITRILGTSVRVSPDSAELTPADLSGPSDVPIVTRGDGGIGKYGGADGFLRTVSGRVISATGIATDDTRVYRGSMDPARADQLVAAWFVPASEAGYWGSEETTVAPSGLLDLNLWVAPGFHPDTAIPGVHTNTPPSAHASDRWSISVIQHGEPDSLLQVAWPSAANLDNGRGIYIRGRRSNGTWTVWHGIPII